MNRLILLPLFTLLSISTPAYSLNLDEPLGDWTKEVEEIIDRQRAKSIYDTNYVVAQRLDQAHLALQNLLRQLSNDMDTTINKLDSDVIGYRVIAIRPCKGSHYAPAYFDLLCRHMN